MCNLFRAILLCYFKCKLFGICYYDGTNVLNIPVYYHKHKVVLCILDWM